MRKILSVLAPPTFAVVALIACEDTEGNDGPSLDLDSGDFSFDAATDDPDGAAPDAPPPIEHVSVTATNDSVPRVGLRVVFHRADGSVIETKLTGTNGKAIHVGADAVMVSALYGPDSDRRIVTWTGVEVGDDLVLKDTLPVGESHSGVYDVTLSKVIDAGVDDYRVSSSCGGTTTNGSEAQLLLFPDCVHAKNSVLVEALDRDAVEPVAFAYEKHVDGLSDGGTSSVALDGWAAVTSFGLHVEHIPSEIFIDTRLHEISDGHAFDFGSGVTDDHYANNPFKIAQGFADAHQVSIRSYTDDGFSILTKRVPGAATSAAVDFRSLLPLVEDVSLDTSNAARPKIAWTSGARLADADGAIFSLRFKTPTAPRVTWSFVMAPSATSVTAPAMPEEAAPFIPSGAGATFATPDALFVEADVFPGYAAFRQKQGLVLEEVGVTFNERGFQALPFDGTYRASLLLAREGRVGKRAPAQRNGLPQPSR